MPRCVALAKQIPQRIYTQLRRPLRQTETGPAVLADSKPDNRRGSIWALPTVLCIALPWLNPFASGPSPATLPLLVSLASMGFLMLLLRRQWAVPAWALCLFFASSSVFFLAHWAVGSRQFSIDHAALQLAVVAVAMCACMGAGIAQKYADNRASADPAQLTQGTQLAHLLAWAWFIAALVNAMVGVCQIFGVAQFFYPWMHAVSDTEVLAVGNLRQRNQLASLCSIGIAALAYLLSRPKQSLSRNAYWASAVAAAVAALLLLLASSASLSRVGLFQCVALALMCGLWWRTLKWPVRCLLLCIVPLYGVCSFLLTYSGLVGDSAFARLGHEVGCSSRKVLYSNVWELVLDKPWLGWGWRELAYAHYSAGYAGAVEGGRFCDILDNAHNLPLHLAVEFGLPFAMLVCAAIAVGLYKAKPWGEKNPFRQMAWLVLLVLGLHSMTEYPLWYGPFLMAFGLALGVLCVKTSKPMQQSAQTLAKSTFCTLSWPVAAIFLITFSGYLSWDYRRVSQIYLPPEERSAAYAQDTMAHVNQTMVFTQHARFAQLMLLAIDKENAQQIYTLAVQVLHFSPEPRVIERLIESATVLGYDDVALAHMAQYRRAFPKDFERWQPSRKKTMFAPAH